MREPSYIQSIPTYYYPTEFPISNIILQPTHIAQPESFNDIQPDIFSIEKSRIIAKRSFIIDPAGNQLCRYCGYKWNPIVVRKMKGSDMLIGSLLGLCFLVPGIIYCCSRGVHVDSCMHCRRSAYDDKYCYC